MASSSSDSIATITLRKRLLLDLAELQSKPYPNITLHIDDSNLTRACLILNADGYGPLHLTVNFKFNYPVGPPIISMDSDIKHPNVFGSYICSSILNTTEGYTSAYTLKGIAIQLLSFFSSDKVEQEGGHFSVELNDYKLMQGYEVRRPYVCNHCDFGPRSGNPVKKVVKPNYCPPRFGPDSEVHWPPLEQQVFQRTFKRRMERKQVKLEASSSHSSSPSLSTRSMQEIALPDEILLLICEDLDTEDLLVFASAWDRIGTLMTNYDLIRTRELQCFCLKTSYRASRLGVGVSIDQGRKGNIKSEFDLLSETAFNTHKIRRSVQGVEFEHWLPLPISFSHWRRVKIVIPSVLRTIQMAARLPGPDVSVIYEFMNSVVVKLNQQASQTQCIPLQTNYPLFHDYTPSQPTSSLTHASEKAIESYFHLFHLLLCLATISPSIISSASTLISTFSSGQTSKTSCPNLGHILIASLISSVPMSEKVLKSLIRETITRNVVWMLSSNPELAYLEPSAVNEYRLKKTFEASLTSYRLLMFLRLFQRVAVSSSSSPDAPPKSLAQLRDEAFSRHGAPPRGAASYLATSIKRIHGVSSFPEFLRVMGLKDMPSKEWFTGFLRECVRDSMAKGYSRWAVGQDELLCLRRERERDVEGREGLREVTMVGTIGGSFFPGRGDGKGLRSKGRFNRGGRAGMRGRGKRDGLEVRWGGGKSC